MIIDDKLVGTYWVCKRTKIMSPYCATVGDVLLVHETRWRDEVLFENLRTKTVWVHYPDSQFAWEDLFDPAPEEDLPLLLLACI